MIKLSQLEDARNVEHDPELWAEVYGYLSARSQEFLSEMDAGDLPDHDFQLSILSVADAAYVEVLGEPEEIACIVVKSLEGVRRIYRAVYPTETVFFDQEVADLLQNRFVPLATLLSTLQ